jgi:hypothetical protein
MLSYYSTGPPGYIAGGIESELIPVLLICLKIPSLFMNARKQESCKAEWKKDQTKVKYFIFVHGSTLLLKSKQIAMLVLVLIH